MSLVVGRWRHQLSTARLARRVSMTLLVLAAFSFVGSSAWAYWTTNGSGNGSAAAGTLNAPDNPAASNTAGSSTVHVTWAAPSGIAPTGYFVTRSSGTASNCGTLASPISAVNCDDTAVSDGTYSYTVTAVFNSWTATSDASNSVTVAADVTPPTVTINQAVGQADPTNSGTVVFTAVFSEAVTGFTNTDVTVTGTAGGTKTVVITGSGPTYTVTVSGMSGNGTIVASIGASTVLDLAGNNNTASTSSDNTITLDTLAPTVTINQAVGQADPTNSGTVVFTAVFSEAVTGFTNTDVTVTGTAGGTKTVVITGSGPTYTVTVSGMTGNGTIIATIPSGAATDAATNPSTGSTSTDNTVTLDTTVPTVSSIVRAGGSAVVKAGPLSWTVTFSEPVNGVTTSNFGLVTSGTGGTAPTITGVTPSAGPSATWTVATSETGTTGTNSGSIGLNLTSIGAIADVATNALSATPPVTGAAYTYDTTRPTATTFTTTNAGTSGRLGAGDTFSIGFSEAIQVSSICATWSGDGSNQALSADNDVTVTLVDGGVGVSDSLTVTSATCTFNLGMLSLGSTAYVSSANVVFNGVSTTKSSITWNATTRVMLITLGTKGGTGTVATVTSSTATFTPSGQLDLAGNAVTGSFSTGNVKQF